MPEPTVRSIAISDTHRLLAADLQKVIRGYAGKVSAPECLAILSQISGSLVALIEVSARGGSTEQITAAAVEDLLQSAIANLRMSYSSTKRLVTPQGSA